jgi:signal transduction histidine kinase
VGEIMSDIETDARRASDVIERIRRFVRRREPSMDGLDINAIVSDVAKLASDELKAGRITVFTNLSSECQLVTGDRTQITQVLLNLVLNAISAMEGVPAEQRRLTLSTAKSDRAVVISVRDTGCGISSENLAHLFEPFFTTRSGGMGLGLSISQSIILAHRGRIWAENNKDQGATFYFSLPVWTPERDDSV